MIALKNFQNLSELLTLEQVTQSVAGHYLDLVSSADARDILTDYINASQQNCGEILAYLKSNA